MLNSLAVIFIAGIAAGGICRRLKLPPLFGMIISGAVLGPSALDIIDESVLNISGELRQIALMIILIRAGLSLDTEDLKKVGRPAVLMCFVPACFEIAGMTFLANRFLGMSLLDSAILGAAAAAVSPAVIVPGMLKTMKEGYGISKSIPQMILAGASVDAVFVIVMFSIFKGMAVGERLSVLSFLKIPASVIIGIAAGILIGKLLSCLFIRLNIKNTFKTIILLSSSFILVSNEALISKIIPFSALVAVISSSAAVQKSNRSQTEHLSDEFSKLWMGAEILLFVLVGASVDASYAVNAGMSSIFIIIGALIFRAAGVGFSLIGTELKTREKFFCMISYIPKATVQAVIGGVPSAMGLSCGKEVQTISVIAILIAASIGAFLIDWGYKRLLEKKE